MSMQVLNITLIEGKITTCHNLPDPSPQFFGVCRRINDSFVTIVQLRSIHQYKTLQIWFFIRHTER